MIDVEISKRKRRKDFILRQKDMPYLFWCPPPKKKKNQGEFNKKIMYYIGSKIIQKDWYQNRT